MKGTLGNAVEITGGSACKVAGCTILGIRRNGVVVKGGRAHRIESCDLHDLRHGGILLGGGHRAALTPAGHVADNNHRNTLKDPTPACAAPPSASEPLIAKKDQPLTEAIAALAKTERNGDLRKTNRPFPRLRG